MPGIGGVETEIPDPLLNEEGVLPEVATDVDTDGAGLLVTLLTVGVWMLYRALASKIGKLRIPIIGVAVDIGHLFTNIGEDIANWIAGNYSGYITGVTRRIAHLARAVDRLGSETVNAVSHLGDQDAEIVNSIIPGVIRGVENYADNDMRLATATVTHELDAAAIQAGRDMSATARDAYERAAGLHTTIENNALAVVAHGVDSAVNFAQGAVDGAADAISNDVGGLFGAAVSKASDPEQRAAQNITSVIGTVKGIEDAAVRDINQELHGLTAGLTPGESIVTATAHAAAGALSSARSSIEDAVTALAEAATGATITTPAGEVRAASTAAGADIGAAISTVSTALAAAQKTLQGHITTLAGQLGTDITNTDTLVASTATSTLATANRALSNALVTVNGSIQGAENAAARGVQTAERDAAADVSSAAKTASAALASGLDSIIVGLGMVALPATAALPAVFEGVTSAIKADIASVRSDVAALAQCTVFACDTPPKGANPDHNFKELLKRAFDFSLFLGLAPVLEQAVANPKGESNTLVAGEQGLYVAADSAVNALIKIGSDLARGATGDADSVISTLVNL